MKDQTRVDGGRLGRSKIKRESMLRAAAALFMEHGYDGVSIDMIIASVGGTKTNVYRHFGGKAELFAAVVEDLWRESVQPFEDIEKLDAEDLPIEQALRQLGQGFLGAICTEREVNIHRMLIAAAPQHPELASRWFSLGPLAAYERFTAYVDKQQRAGRLVSMPARRLAPLFIDMLSQELYLRMMIGGSKAPKRTEIDAIVDRAVDIFLHGALLDPRR